MASINFAAGYLYLHTMLLENPFLIAKLNASDSYKKRFYETLSFKYIYHHNHTFAVKRHHIGVLIAQLCDRLDDYSLLTNKFRWGMNEGHVDEEVILDFRSIGVEIHPWDYDEIKSVVINKASNNYHEAVLTRSGAGTHPGT